MSAVPDTATATTAPASRTRSASIGKRALWALLALASLWVLLSNEVLLLLDYPLYREYRLVMIQDRALLIPHALFGCIAFFTGPLQFSSRLRQRRLGLHRLLGRCYVIAVYASALTAFAIGWGRPLMPATLAQGGTWILVTTAAWVLARNGHLAAHRQWVARSYAVTFTFVSLRIPSIWPAYWNLSEASSIYVITAATLASVLVADLVMNWRELGTGRG